MALQHKQVLTALFFVVGTCFGSVTKAALYDRGGGLLYDDVLNITWLQDANYAKTSGYSQDGWMNWQQSMAWVEQLTYAGFDDWRLPNVSPVSGSDYTNRISYDGSTDYSFNITSTHSELSYMYYVNLHSVGAKLPDGNDNPGYTGPLSAFQDTANNNAIKYTQL